MNSRWSPAILSAAILLLIGPGAAAQLSGAYTIDPTGSGGRNFTSFGAAVGTLSASGVKGPVTFSVAPATFREVLRLNRVKGMSSINTVTFTARPGAPGVLDANQSAFGLIGFEIAWFRFAHLRFVNASAYGLYLFSSGLGGLDRNYEIRFTDCEFQAPFFKTFARAAFLGDTHDTTFLGCRFVGGTRTVHLDFSSRCAFRRCVFDGANQAEALLHFNGGQDTDHLFINGLFTGCGHETGHAIGVQSTTTGMMFWHNTIVVNTRSAAVILFTGTRWGDTVSFRNNLVVNLGPGWAVRHDYHPIRAPFGDFDHNAYWAPNSSAGVIDTRDPAYRYRGNLAGWKRFVRLNPPRLPPVARASWDENSIEADPRMVRGTRPYDPRLQPGSPLIDAGTRTYVAGPWVSYPAGTTVHTDADGDPRGVLVDIGMDEVAPAITASGSATPGGRVRLALVAPQAAGLGYQVGAALSPGVIPVGIRHVPLALDAVFRLSVAQVVPAVFHAYRGFLDGSGRGAAEFRIPGVPALKGVSVHHAFVTLDQNSPHGIRGISRAVAVPIQ